MSRRQRRSFTRDFKLAALKRMAETDSIRALSQELGIERKLLYVWRGAYAAGGDAGLRRAGRPSAADQAEAALLLAETCQQPVGVTQAPPCAPDQPRVAALERKIGEQQVALDFFRAALRHVRQRRQTDGVPGGKVSTP